MSVLPDFAVIYAVNNLRPFMNVIFGLNSNKTFQNFSSRSEIAEWRDAPCWLMKKTRNISPPWTQTFCGSPQKFASLYISLRVACWERRYANMWHFWSRNDYEKTCCYGNGITKSSVAIYQLLSLNNQDSKLLRIWRKTIIQWIVRETLTI